MISNNETVCSACRRLAAAGIDLTQLRTAVVDTANRDKSAIRLIALFGTLRQGDLTILFGVSKVTTSRLVTRLIATEQVRASITPGGARGRPSTWLLLPGTALPSVEERQAIGLLVNDAAIVLQAAGADVQFPNCTMALSTEGTPATPATSAPPNDDPTDAPHSSKMEAIQLELPELATPDNRLLDLALQTDTVGASQPRSSVPPQQRLPLADAAEFHGEPLDPFPAALLTTHANGDVLVESARSVQAASALPPFWPAAGRSVWPTRDTEPHSPPPWETSAAGTEPRTATFVRQPARARIPPPPPWQRPSFRIPWYERNIVRRLCIWHCVRRVGNCRVTLGHRVNLVGNWLLLNLQRIGGGIWRALGYIGHGAWRAMRGICAVIGWMSQCIAAVHEMTDHHIWSATFIIAFAIAGYLMFPLVGSMNVIPSMETAPISAPSSTPVPIPTAAFRWARVVGTQGVGLLVRNLPNGKRRLGDGLPEGTIVMVISGPATTADAQNPTWWQVRHNGVTGWVSGRFLTFTDQAP